MSKKPNLAKITTFFTPIHGFSELLLVNKDAAFMNSRLPPINDKIRAKNTFQYLNDLLVYLGLTLVFNNFRRLFKINFLMFFLKVT